jgi:hypothetical protein
MKFSIVREGQETKKTHSGLGNCCWTIMLQIRTAPCPILVQDKCDNDKKEKLGLCFVITLQNRKFEEILFCALWHN